MKRQHWFHCTSDNHGPVFVAKRRAPKHMSQNEPSTPRLCVAPTIARCFAAVLFKEFRPVYCYRTEKPCKAVKPRNVWDQVVTGEHWLIPPTRMILDRVIDVTEATRAQWLVREYHCETGKNAGLFTRVAQLAIASEVVGTDRDRNRARRCLGIVGIDDPELFLMAQICGE